ncbi:protein yippee [Trifolium repens]|nr:protein yippee [Trifolium repens]
MQIEGIQRSQHNTVLINEQQLNDAQSQPLRNNSSKLTKSTLQCCNGGNELGRYSPPDISDDGGSSHTPPPQSTIPRALEQSPKLEVYNGTGDTDEDVEHIDIVLDYMGSEVVRLPFYSSKASPKDGGFPQHHHPGKERNHVRTNSMFKEKLGLKELRDMRELLTRAQPCINYEEELWEEEDGNLRGSDDHKGGHERRRKDSPKQHIRRSDSPRRKKSPRRHESLPNKIVDSVKKKEKDYESNEDEGHVKGNAPTHLSWDAKLRPSPSINRTQLLTCESTFLSTASYQQTHTHTHRIYTCKFCRTHLALYEDIVSKTFHSRHGKAYLFNKVVNVSLGETEERQMMTGQHTVADIFCVGCGSIVGWKYETAHEKDQKYKEGKSVLERYKVSGPDGSNYRINNGAHVGGSDADDI